MQARNFDCDQENHNASSELIAFMKTHREMIVQDCIRLYMTTLKENEWVKFN